MGKYNNPYISNTFNFITFFAFVLGKAKLYLTRLMLTPILLSNERITHMPVFKLDRTRKRAIVAQAELGLSSREISLQFDVSVQTIRTVLKAHSEDEFAYTVCLQCGGEPEKDYDTHCANKECLAQWLKHRCVKYRANLGKYLKTKDGKQTIEIPQDDLYEFIRVIAAMDSLIAKGGLSYDKIKGAGAADLSVLS